MRDEITLKNIMKVCEGCKYFSISVDGDEEHYECLNDKRLEDLGYDEDDYEMYMGGIYIIAVARHTLDGKLIDVELVDMDFDFDGCKWKEEDNAE